MNDLNMYAICMSLLFQELHTPLSTNSPSDAIKCILFDAEERSIEFLLLKSDYENYNLDDVILLDVNGHVRPVGNLGKCEVKCVYQTDDVDNLKVNTTVNAIVNTSLCTVSYDYQIRNIKYFVYFA